LERSEAKLGARRRFEERTYYEMLEVSPRASRREVDAAYARANELYRSDSLPLYTLLESQACEEVRRAIDAAYRTLADERARAEYDRHLVSSGRLAPEDVRPDAPEESPPAPSEGAPAAHSPRLPRSAEASILRSPTEDGLREGESALAQPGAHGAAGQVIPMEAHVTRSAPTPTLASGQEAPADAPDLVGNKSEQEKPQRFDGPGLKAVREAQGRDLESIARVTKIPISRLLALESNHYSHLPVRVYLKGFVKEYARSLGLDPEKVAEEYLRRSGR
jgi:curved DNA-binding protein CbpA